MASSSHSFSLLESLTIQSHQLTLKHSPEIAKKMIETFEPHLLLLYSQSMNHGKLSAQIQVMVDYIERYHLTTRGFIQTAGLYPSIDCLANLLNFIQTRLDQSDFADIKLKSLSTAFRDSFPAGIHKFSEDHHVCQQQLKEYIDHQTSEMKAHSSKVDQDFEELYAAIEGSKLNIGYALMHLLTIYNVDTLAKALAKINSPLPLEAKSIPEPVKPGKP